MHRISYFLFLFGCCLTIASAQQRPTPPNAAPKREPAGGVRVWHFAPSLKAPAAVSLVGGTGAPIILGRSVLPGTLISYRDVRPGRYKIVIQPAAADQSNQLSQQDMLPSTTIDVGDNTFQTIILQDAGSAKVSVLNDAIAGGAIPPDASRLRIFDFVPDQPVSLKLSPSDEVISPAVPLGASEYLFRSNPGRVTIAMVSKLKNARESRQYSELDFTHCRSISAIIMLDRYGRLTFQVTEDGSGG